MVPKNGRRAGRRAQMYPLAKKEVKEIKLYKLIYIPAKKDKNYSLQIFLKNVTFMNKINHLKIN